MPPRDLGGHSDQDREVLGGHTQFIVEGLVSDLLHIVPVGDNAVFNGVLWGQDASLALSLSAYKGVLLTHIHYDALVPRAGQDGGEDCPGASEPVNTALPCRNKDCS